MRILFASLATLFMGAAQYACASATADPDFSNPDVLNSIIRCAHVEGEWAYHLPKFPRHLPFKDGQPVVLYEKVADHRHNYVSLGDPDHIDVQLMQITGNIQLSKDVYSGLLNTVNGPLKVERDDKGYLLTFLINEEAQPIVGADQVATRVMRTPFAGVHHAAVVRTFLERAYYTDEIDAPGVLDFCVPFSPIFQEHILKLMGLAAQEGDLVPLTADTSYMMDESRVENIQPKILRSFETYVAEEGLQPEDKRVLIVARGRLDLDSVWCGSSALAFAHRPYTLDVSPCKFPDAVWSIVDPELRTVLPAGIFDELFFEGLTYSELWSNPEIARNTAHLLKDGGLMYKDGGAPKLDIFAPLGFTPVEWDGILRVTSTYRPSPTSPTVNNSQRFHYLRLSKEAN